MRLLLDEMYAPAIAADLRARGHDAVSVHHWGDTPLSGASDDDVLAAAAADHRVLVTENVRDYRPVEAALLASGGHHHGIVFTTNRQFPRGDPSTIGRLVLALDALARSQTELADQLMFLTWGQEG